MIKITVMSDLHYEWHKDFPDIPKEVEVVVLAGDIISWNHLVDLKLWVEQYPDKQFIMVAGNHDYYSTVLTNMVNYYRDWFKEIPNLNFLENEVYEYKNIVFHGCTLWTDFSCKGDAWKNLGMMEAERSISDFFKIGFREGMITPQDMSDLHTESLQWLSGSIKTHSDKVNVVVTHFPPMIECKHPKIPEGILDTYFNNDLIDFVYNHRIDYWIYGHNHWSDRFKLMDTEFVSNQRGYPREFSNFDSNLILNI